MTQRFVGVMSGTSIDGLDLALVDCPVGASPRLIARHDATIPPPLTERLRSLAGAATWSPADLLAADVALGECIGDAILALLERTDTERTAVRAIGSHGQTIRHLPDSPQRMTLQIGDPNRIAERTGIDVVADFRRRDQAAGGEGAPLVPLFHAALFGRPDRVRIVANIGGIANITVLDRDRPLRGFDTGPGNTLMDAWSRQHRGIAYDDGGAWAATGTIDHRLLDALLADSWFRREGARSTGPERFNLAWARERFPDLSSCDPADVQATLTELTAVTLARAADMEAPGAELLLGGGGRHNRTLVERLQAHAQRPIGTVDAAGVDGDALEAMAFAWLAHRFIEGLPGSAPTVTGANGPRVLGALYPGSGRPGLM